MNCALVSSSPLECVYSRSVVEQFVERRWHPPSRWLRSARARPHAAPPHERCLSRDRRRTSRAATAKRTAGGVVRRVFIKVWLVAAGRGCYDATRSPIDQTLSERPSSMRAPKAQVSARKRSGKRTAGFEGGLWRVMAPSEWKECHPPKGCGSRLFSGPDLSGPRTEGRREMGTFLICCNRLRRGVSATRYTNEECPHFPAAFFIGARAGAPGDDLGQTHTSYTTCTSSSAPAWSISAAGTCRSTTARRSRSTTRCAATRAYSTCHTCA